jgi:hypothetical protein
LALNPFVVVLGIHEEKIPIFAIRNCFAVLLQRSCFTCALNRGVCTRQDRPLCGFVLKLTNCADELVGFVRP